MLCVYIYFFVQHYPEIQVSEYKILLPYIALYQFVCEVRPKIVRLSSGGDVGMLRCCSRSLVEHLQTKTTVQSPT